MRKITNLKTTAGVFVAGALALAMAAHAMEMTPHRCEIVEDDVRAVAQARDSGMTEDSELGITWFPGADPAWRPALQDLMKDAIHKVYGEWKSLTPNEAGAKFYRNCVGAQGGQSLNYRRG
jgi:hypothetical protein